MPEVNVQEQPDAPACGGDKERFAAYHGEHMEDTVDETWFSCSIPRSELKGTSNSPLKKALLTGFHSTAKHNATKAVSPSSETMRTI